MRRALRPPRFQPRALRRRFAAAAGGARASRVAELLASSPPAGGAGVPAAATGWVTSVRSQKHASFLQLSDGSSVAPLQVVWASDGSDGPRAAGATPGLAPGAAVSVAGALVRSPKPAQPVELLAREVTLHGASDALRYPLAARAPPSNEWLRDHAHLRPRTQAAGAVLRLRHTLAAAAARHLDGEGYVAVTTPVLTTNDCEGAGELFRVLPAADAAAGGGGGGDAGAGGGGGGSSLHGGGSGDGGEGGGGGGRSGGGGGGSASHLSSPAGSTAGAPAGSPAGAPRPPGDSFFGRPVYLTVSGQLHLEAFANALGRVYTFGPAFRAEHSTTPRHLAEFTMLEPELAPGGLDDAMALAEGCVRAMARAALEQRPEEVALFTARAAAAGEPPAARPAARLERLADAAAPFARMTYAAAVAALRGAAREWRAPVDAAAGLATEHERWLAEELVGGPVFVTHYPAALKPFYMRAAGGEAECFDLLAPRVGELAGGSAREERFDVLARRMAAARLLSPAAAAALAGDDGGRAFGPADAGNGTLDWYLDTRRYGAVPHAGFGLGFDRLVMLAAGLDNIRDAVPVPRVPGSCRM